MAYIAISRSAFFHNLDIIAQRTGSIDKIALVLKDNAYGHGLEQMAKLAFEYGIGKAIVRSSDEAEQIQEYFDYLLVLTDLPADGRQSEKIRYAINAMEQIEKFPKGCRVELKVDTGMHRNGIAPQMLERAFGAIQKAGLRLEAVFTHHRSADTLSSEWFWQTKSFDRVKEEASKLAEMIGFSPLRFHSANSASLFRHEAHSEDMVRIGIAAYGCLQMGVTLLQPNLIPILSLWGEKLASRVLQPGQRVGYNGTYSAEKMQPVSTYDIGYADGMLRAASGRYVTPGNVALLGRISMDNSSFAAEDDTLLIFDDANMLAEAAGTIGYEVLAGLHPKLERRIIG
jgi:alanine racemase